MSPRALVTGFHDWRTLHPPGNQWWCHENPSGRLLLGAPWSSAGRPAPGDCERGPLPPRLRALRPDVAWSFATLPVRWGAGDAVDWAAWDLVVDLGLGVYDGVDRLQLERGAINLRDGRPDAAGEPRVGPIDPGAPDMLEAPGPIDQVLTDMSRGATYAGYRCSVADARPDNAFVCNDTHFRGLQALARGAGRLRAVAFLHIPYAPAGDDGLSALADGVAALLAAFAERLELGAR